MLQDSVNVHQSNVTVRCYARFIIEIIESMLIYEKKKNFEEHVSESFILNERKKDYSSNYNIIFFAFVAIFKQIYFSIDRDISNIKIRFIF